MGEWSKTLGEEGERISKFLFEEILGINSLEENITLNCKFGEKHKRKEAKGNRQTHGLDGLYYIKSPLEDELLDVAIVSTKYPNEYPKNPRSKFLAYLKDLSEAIECFKLSEKCNTINQAYSDVTKSNYTGILVWLSNSDLVTDEILPKISKTQVPSDLEFEKVIVIDNSRINFLYQTIFKTKEKRSKVEYVYHDTSLNTTSLNDLSYGSIFPINYLYSDIIILRIEENSNVEFLIFINDNFDSNNFEQVLSFSKSFNHLNAVDKTTIGYLTYDKLSDENIVKSTLSKFSNYKLNENLFIQKFPLDFRQ